MFNFREITRDEDIIKEWAEIVSKHSWGADYPINPLDELIQSDYIVGCFDEKILVGLGAINRVTSPDGIDNGFPWLSFAVTLPQYRGKGLYKEIYKKRIEYLLEHTNESDIFTCTDNEIVENFLLQRKWTLDRIIEDEWGDECKVFQLKLLRTFSED